MATNRPLGYDLFLFIIHTRLVMGADERRILVLLKENVDYILKYFNEFNISDYRPYLPFFPYNTFEKRKGKREHTNGKMLSANTSKHINCIMMVKKRILFIIPLPPPVHGSAMMNQYIKESKLINGRLIVTL